MSLQTRLKHLEKNMASASEEVGIKVAVMDDDGEFEREYSVFQAMKRLGMLTPKEIRNTIWVQPESDEPDPYENLTEDEAKAILEKFEEVTA